jgi:hypothetical protein
MENPERDHHDDLSIDEMIKLKWILKKWESVDWINLAQDRDHGRTVVNTFP